MSLTNCEQRDLLESAFAHSKEGMILTDPDSVILGVNHAFCKMSGFQRDELIGSHPSIMHSGYHDKNFYQDLWQTVRHRGFWQGEVWDRKKSGSITPRHLNIQPITNQNGETIFYLGLMTDHSDLYEMTCLANQDALTGLANRRLFEERLQHNIAHARRHNEKIALLYIDLDRFKHINDTCGHRIGDKLLIQIAERLQDSIRAEDTAARLGGDEFVILLSDIHTTRDVKHFASKIIERVNQPYDIEDQQLNIGCSIGFSLFPEHSNNIDNLINIADLAMYQAKRSGRNTVCCY